MADHLLRQQPPGNARSKALNCANCHAVNGVLNFKELGYNAKEIEKLTNPDIYFRKMLEKQKEAW